MRPRSVRHSQACDKNALMAPKQRCQHSVLWQPQPLIRANTRAEALTQCQAQPALTQVTLLPILQAACMRRFAPRRGQCARRPTVHPGAAHAQCTFSVRELHTAAWMHLFHGIVELQSMACNIVVATRAQPEAVALVNMAFCSLTDSQHRGTGAGTRCKIATVRSLVSLASAAADVLYSRLAAANILTVVMAKRDKRHGN